MFLRCLFRSPIPRGGTGLGNNPARTFHGTAPCEGQRATNQDDCLSRGTLENSTETLTAWAGCHPGSASPLYLSEHTMPPCQRNLGHGRPQPLGSKASPHESFVPIRERRQTRSFRHILPGQNHQPPSSPTCFQEGAGRLDVSSTKPANSKLAYHSCQIKIYQEEMFLLLSATALEIERKDSRSIGPQIPGLSIAIFRI